jgi:glycosyltransferase involved in cell wall biosynthesis
MDNNLAIIIPSYNDAENIPLVVQGIRLVTHRAQKLSLLMIQMSNKKGN